MEESYLQDTIVGNETIVKETKLMIFLFLSILKIYLQYNRMLVTFVE